jgi:Flp pilus assembly pilin Flp
MASIREYLDRLILGLWCRQRGQGLTEYGLILVVVSIAAIVLITSMGPKIASMFSSAGASLK